MDTQSSLKRGQKGISIIDKRKCALKRWQKAWFCLFVCVSAPLSLPEHIFPRQEVLHCTMDQCIFKDGKMPDKLT